MDSISRSKFVGGRWVSLRTVVIMRMLFGSYCNIGCNKILSCLARLYCICLGTVTTTMLYINSLKNDYDILFYLPVCFEYIINGLVSIFTGENHIINFYKEIERIDREIGLEHQPFLPIRCQVLFMFFCGYIHIILFLLYYGVKQQYSFLFTSIVMTYSMIFGDVGRCFPLELLRLRVKHLWYGLEMDLKRENWRENINQINSVKQTLKLYRNFMDKLMVMPWEKFLICVNLLYAFIYALVNSRNLILSFKNENFEETYLIKIVSVDAIVGIALSCLPPIVCEMIAKEVDQLKIVIGNALLVCDDAELHVELQRAANYLAMRPFSATVCRAFALDATLVITFLSLYTTYTIVVIQYLGIL